MIQARPEGETLVTRAAQSFAAYQQAYATQYPGLGLTSILTDAAPR